MRRFHTFDEAEAKPTDSDESKFRHEAFWKLREELSKRELSNSENLDRSVLTLSTGTLAASVTFLNYHGDSHYWLMVLAWACMFFCIISLLFSYHLSQVAMRKAMIHTQNFYILGDKDAFNGPNKAARWNDWINPLASILFAVGLLLMVIFFAINGRAKKETVHEKAGGNTHVQQTSGDVLSSPSNGPDSKTSTASSRQQVVEHGREEEVSDANKIIERGAKPTPMVPLPTGSQTSTTNAPQPQPKTTGGSK